MEGDYSDFRMPLDKIEIVKTLLKEGKSYSEIGRLIDLDPRTIKRIHTRMIELEEIEEQEEKEEVSYVPLGEYQRLLKRVQKLEGWRDNGYVKAHNDLLHYVTGVHDPHFGRLDKKSDDLIDDFAFCRGAIEQLQWDVRVIKEVRKREIAELMEKSAKRRLERDQAREEANKRIVEDMAEERRKKEQGSIDTFFRKLEEIKIGKRSY